MPSGVLFIVVPELDAPKVKGLVDGLIVPSRRHAVMVLNDALTSAPSRDFRGQGAVEIIDRISTFQPDPDDLLVIDRNARCSINELVAWWKDRASGVGGVAARKLSSSAITRTVREYLKARSMDWRSHALVEIGKFDGPSSSLDGWLQQFGELGCTQIGRKIAAKLRVLRARDLPGNPFALRVPDTIGQRQARCYVQDDDAGGSWVDMQGLLAHACPPDTVFPVKWDEAAGRMEFPDTSVDEFVIYEDGLWSGNEAVRRLRAIALNPPTATMIFRFGIVTDFGLMVCRHAIRSLGLSGRVHIDARFSEVIRFLNGDVPENLKIGLHESMDEYFEELHKYVSPYAFDMESPWTNDEIEICRDIGVQLIFHWLSQRASGPPSMEKVERFALGGGQFASTVVFSRSVPKVCLPFLWLDGPVEHNGKVLQWRPLFLDARRVSDINLLHLL